MDPIALTIGASVALLIALWVILKILMSFLHICQPNEVIVFTGRGKTVGGRRVGYSVLKHGRRVRWPIVEQAQVMDVSTMTVDIRVTNAFSKGNIPLNVHAIANVRISSEDSVLENAIERFLGRNREEIRRVGKETIEGVLRGVLARLTPEQVNEDRLKFVQALSDDAEDDLRKIGLKLDTLKIQSVTDEVNYLDSIGRARIADVLRDAEVAESDNRRQADQAVAEAEGRGRVAQEQASSSVQAKKNELRRILAELNSRYRSEEERTTAAETEARARAEVALQELRTELERLRLQADQVLPADAQRQASELRAQGDAAVFAAEGRATAQALQLMSEAWRGAGSGAADMYLLQRFDGILRRVVDQLGQIEIEQVNVVDTGDGQAMGRLAASYPAMVGSVLREIGDSVGIDIRELLRRTSPRDEVVDVAARRVARPGPAPSATPATGLSNSTWSSESGAGQSAAPTSGWSSARTAAPVQATAAPASTRPTHTASALPSSATAATPTAPSRTISGLGGLGAQRVEAEPATHTATSPATTPGRRDGQEG